MFFPFDFFDRQPLEKPCECGFCDDDGEGFQCSEIGLRNHAVFPPFSMMSDERDPDFRFFNASIYKNDVLHLGTTRHWCFLGEITHMLTLGRLRLFTRTKFGEEVGVHFHLDSAQLPWLRCLAGLMIPPENISVGNTLAILYAERHQFLDGSVGIRQETVNNVYVFRASLPTLIEESAARATNACFQCGKTGNLLTCAQCRISRYCTKECQRNHWKKTHKKLCKQMKALEMLRTLKDTPFCGSHLTFDPYF
eukprot:GEMP01071326.1.p1 GENE.GEMP01071326.1~~GEMP01071326.1.p1  ORF type:complete len:251 (+),score=45.52 GEMP01071326.1:83-835(+)